MVIDLLVKLDALKDMKACLQNDFSRYKRSFSSIRGEMPNADQISEEIQNLQMFLCNPEKPHDYIIWRLKTELFKIGGFDDVLIQLLEHCYEALEKKFYLLPSEKHALYRVILQLIYLLDEPIRDPDNDKTFNVFNNRKLKNFEKFKILFQNTPIIYLYGDMTVSVEYVLRKCPHWDEEMSHDWNGDVSKTEGMYLLRHQLPIFRKNFMLSSSLFSQMINDIEARQQSNRTITLDMMETIVNTITDGLKLLCLLSAKVLEQAAWKYARACSRDDYVARGGKSGPGKEYEQVVRFNYSAEDLNALIEGIAMIKSLGGLFSRHANLVVPMLSRYMHDKLQEFVQQKLARPLRKAFKKKKSIEPLMLQMRALGGDWLNISSATDDYLQVKDDIEKIIRDFPRRNVSPSLTQISLIRRLMHTIFDSRAPGMNPGYFEEADLKPEWVAEWQAFYDESYFYKYFLDYQHTVTELSDLSFLWYREFYLEMTKQLQFPIAMSMPWILIEHIIERVPNASEQVFMCLDIYNDAADVALKHFKKQFLYDEAEAEANLSFEQLVFSLAEHIYIHYKNHASYLLFDKDFRIGLKGINKPVPTVDNFVRYEGIMTQRNIRLLGRSIDLNAILAQHISSTLRKNIDAVIAKFESSDITCMVELSTQIRHLQTLHDLLSKHLQLDPFEAMFSEMNDSVSVGNVRGRIVVHVVSELVSDLLVNFNYNSTTRRFVRHPSSETVPFAEVSRDPPRTYPNWYWYGDRIAKQWEASVKLTKGFFGTPHVEAILNILSPVELPLVISELFSHVEQKIKFTLSSYVTVLMDSIPPMKLPSLQFGVIGAYGYFDLKLKYVASYGPLRSEVFQVVREIGNSLCFIHLVESLLDLQQNMSFATNSYFLGVRPSQPAFDHTDEIPSLLEVFPRFQSPFVNLVRKAVKTPGALELRGPIHANDSIYNLEEISKRIEDTISLPPVRTSFLTTALSKLSMCIADSVMVEWLGWDAENDVFEVENARDIARVWSVFQYIFCMGSPQNLLHPSDKDRLPSNMALFGEGWAWAGCAFLHVLGLRERFEILDFSYFILNINSVIPYVPTAVEDKRKPAAKTPEQEILPFLEYFLQEGENIKSINESCFSLFQAHFPSPPHPFMNFRPPAPPPPAAVPLASQVPVDVAAASLVDHTQGAAKNSNYTASNTSQPLPPPANPGGLKYAPPRRSPPPQEYQPPPPPQNSYPPPPTQNFGPPQVNQSFGPPPVQNFAPPPQQNSYPPPPPQQFNNHYRQDSYSIQGYDSNYEQQNYQDSSYPPPPPGPGPSMDYNQQGYSNYPPPPMH